MKNECPNCGYQFSSRDAKCPYCGTANPNYSSIFNTAKNDSSSDTNSAYKSTVDNIKKELKFSWVLFIVLLIVCWPVAIIYLVITAVKK